MRLKPIMQNNFYKNACNYCLLNLSTKNVQGILYNSFSEKEKCTAYTEFLPKIFLCKKSYNNNNF